MVSYGELLAIQCSIISSSEQGFFSIQRVKSLYQMFKTLVGQCRIYLNTKCTLKIYNLCKLLLNHIIESLFLLYHDMPNHSI